MWALSLSTADAEIKTAYIVGPLLCTADAEIKVLSVENPGLSKVFSVKPGIGQNIAMHASPAARNVFLVLISTFLSIHLPIYSKSSHYFCELAE